MLRPIASMSIELRSVVVWLLAFLAYELCAHFHADRRVAATAILAVGLAAVALWPILTLSGTVWGGEEWWHPLADALIVFTFVLLVHLRWRLSASYLIAVAVAIAVATVVHWAVSGHSPRHPQTQETRP